MGARRKVGEFGGFGLPMLVNRVKDTWPKNCSNHGLCQPLACISHGIHNIP